MYQTLSTENVDTRYMSLDPQHRTSIVAVGLDEQGERNFTFMVRPSADLFLQPDDLPAFGPGEWLHLCSIALSAEPSRSTAFLAMEKIRQAGGNISFDPNIRSDLWQSEALLRKYLDRALSLANIAKLSEEELLFISDESRSARRIFISTTLSVDFIAYYTRKKWRTCVFSGAVYPLSRQTCFCRRYDRGRRCFCRWITCRSG